MKPLYQTLSQTSSEDIQQLNSTVNTCTRQSGTLMHREIENNPHVISEVAHTNVQYGNTVPGINVNSIYHGKQSISKPLRLGVDSKTKAKIWVQEYIDLTQKPLKQRFQPVEQGANTLVYEKLPLPQFRFQNIAHWLSAFHIFVSIYCQKYPLEACSLMKYASIMQTLSKQATDQAAYKYDRVFRTWRESDHASLPWDQVHSELHHECLSEGLVMKTKDAIDAIQQYSNRSHPTHITSVSQQLNNQPFPVRKNSPKWFCFQFNNKDGKCLNGNNCKHPHICQLCGSNAHSKRFCPSSVKKSGTGQQILSSQHNIQGYSSIKISATKKLTLPLLHQSKLTN